VRTSLSESDRHFLGRRSGSARRTPPLALALVLACAAAAATSCSEKEGGEGVVPDAAATQTPPPAGRGVAVDPETRRRTNVKAPPLPAMPDVVATVNGVPIPRVRFEDALIRKFESQTFAIMTLVWLEAYEDFGKKRGLEVTEKDVDAELARIVEAQKLPDVDALLRIKCFDLPYLRRQVEFRLWVNRLAEHLGLAQPGVETKTTDPRILETVAAESDVKMRADGIPDTAFAVVNGRPVAQKDVLAWSTLYAMPDEVAKELEALITSEIDRQEVARAGIALEGMEVLVAGQPAFRTWDQIVEANRQTAKARGGDWDRAVRRSGQTVEQWIENQKRAESTKALIQREATEEMIRRYFEENKDMLLLGEKLHVAALSVDEAFLRKPGQGESEESKAAAKARIEAARAALDGGMSFEDALREFGTDRSMIDHGGDLGWMNLYQVDKAAIRDAAAALEVGKTSAPFEYRNVWFIVKLLEKKPAADIERVLMNKEQRDRVVQRLATYAQWLWRDPVKARSEIRIFVDLPLPYEKA
jgi:hypothetical protein